MPIFDQGYQHWIGKLSGHTWRWLAVTRHGVRATFKNRNVKILLFVAWAPALALVTVISCWGLLEQRVESVMPLMQAILPVEIFTHPYAFRAAVWTILYQVFFKVELIFAMFLVLAIGPGLISQDLRFNALPLYFSRPLRRFDYFLGKLGVIGFFLASTTIVPATAAYLLGVAFSLDFGVVRDTHRLLWGGALYGLIITVSAGTAMLALSALTRRSLLVGLAWAAFCFFSSMLSNILVEIDLHRPHDAVRERNEARMQQGLPPEEAALYSNDWRRVVSYIANLNRIGDWLLDSKSAWSTFEQTVSQSGAAIRGRFGRNPGGRFGADPTGNQNEHFLTDAWVLQFPVSWSIGVLVGLWMLSALFLSSRVKSLDRLK